MEHRQRHTRRFATALVVLALLAAACGRSEDPEPAAADDPSASAGDQDDRAAECDGAELEATDTGITADTITVQVMADTGSPLAPGLFQGNIDGVKAWAEWVNEEKGGVACREVRVLEWDSKLSAEESKNGLINACQNAFAMVGGNALFNPDPKPIEDCQLPNLAALAADVSEQCSTTTYLLQSVSENCPIVHGQPRVMNTFSGATKWYIEQFGDDLHGVNLIPGDLPATVQGGVFVALTMARDGITWDAMLKVSGRDPQAAYTPKVQELKAKQGNFVYDGSNDVAMINMMKETRAQGYDGVEVWACSLACYTRNMLGAGGADVEGTYLWLPFLPFEEAEENEALQAYVDAVGVNGAVSWGAQAWQAGMLFEHVVNRIVEEDGLNAVTRARMLEELPTVDDFTAEGWLGDVPKDLRGLTRCMVIMQIEDGAFVRRYPEEPGTLDCDESYAGTITLDPEAEAAKIR